MTEILHASKLLSNPKLDDVEQIKQLIRNFVKWIDENFVEENKENHANGYLEFIQAINLKYFHNPQNIKDNLIFAYYDELRRINKMGYSCYIVDDWEESKIIIGLIWCPVLIQEYQYNHTYRELIDDLIMKLKPNDDAIVCDRIARTKSDMVYKIRESDIVKIRDELYNVFGKGNIGVAIKEHCVSFRYLKV
jgi:hypothetical protein